MMPITNHSSTSNVSAELSNLLDEVKDVYIKIFGANLSSLYLAGSIPRSQFTAHKSDADFYGITQTPQTELETELEDALLLLTEKWRKAGVTSVDGKVFSVADLHTREEQRTAFILQTDATCIYGQPQDLSFAIPDSLLNLATVLNERARVRLSFIEQPLHNGESTHKDVQRLIKLTTRCAFGVALMNGTAYTPQYEQYPQAIETYVPEIAEKIHELQDSKDALVPTPRMVDLSKEVLQFAEKLGVRFLES